MFNVTVKGNVRCNGIIPAPIGGMANKRTLHVNNSSAMSPNRSSATLSDPANKLKFSDRLKAYLSTDPLRSDASADLEDPYTFSDTEHKLQNHKPVVVKRCGPSNTRILLNNHVHSQNNVELLRLSVVNNKNKVNNHVNSERHSELSVTGKTMGRLQAQIARNKITVKHTSRLSPDLKFDAKIHQFEKNAKHSIIGLVNNVNSNNKSVIANRRLPPSGKPIPAQLRARRSSSKGATHHEGSLQRVPPAPSTRWHAPQPMGPLTPGASPPDSEDDDFTIVHQTHWFSKELELLSVAEGHRQARLDLTRLELKRQLLQMKRSKIGQLHPSPLQSTSTRALMADMLKTLARHRKNTAKSRTSTTTGLMATRLCDVENCTGSALPCTKHCTMHVMKNTEQVLFDHCTAKFADNTQCSVPVFDITHELPLCIEHARKRDNYNRMCLETKPKKPRRKIKPSAMIRPQKRSKKRKRSPKGPDLPHTQTTLTNCVDVTELNICETSSAYESSEEIALETISESEFVSIKEDNIVGDQDVVEQVLAMQDEVGGDLGLVVEQTLVTQASRLLEETDFTTVLNQIPADEFNDLFAVDRNGEYEPSREETEELERALEAVDEDVKSLEKLSQTQGLLDSLLDEHTLVESLVQIPDVFHNGYATVHSGGSPASHTASPRPLPYTVLHDGMLATPQAHAPS